MSVLDDIDGIHDRIKELGIKPIWRRCDWVHSLAGWSCKTCHVKEGEGCFFAKANPDWQAKRREIEAKHYAALNVAKACTYCQGPHDAIECPHLFLG